MALGFVRYTRGLGRKRIVILNDSEKISASVTPLKKQCSRGIKFNDSEESSCSMMTPLTNQNQCSGEIEFDDSEESSCSMMTPLKNQNQNQSQNQSQNQCSREIEFDDSEEPLKNQCSGEIKFDDTEISLLECLPQDILVRVLCGVNHEDLKQLFHVSKSVREATSIAKQYHFAYSTPKKTRVFPQSFDFENPSYLDEIVTPNAPKQVRLNRSRISDKKLADISVSLFRTSDEDRWPKKGLIFDTEV